MGKLKKTIWLLLFSIIFTQQVWQYVGLENQIDPILIDRSDESIIFVGTSIGGSYLLKSNNYGTSWDTLLSSVNVRSIVQHPYDDQTLFISHSGGIKKTIDAGWNWIEIDSGIVIGDCLSAGPLAVNYQNPEIMYCGTGGCFGGELYKSEDGGYTWTSISDGLIYDSITTIKINPENPDIVFVGCTSGNGIYKSVDGGINWEFLATEFDFSWISSIEIDPNYSDIIYVGIPDYGIIKSVDGGMTWFNINQGLTEIGNLVSTLIINPLNSEELFAGTYETGVLRSINSGSYWTQYNENLTNTWILTFAMPNNGCKLYCGTFSGLFKIDINISVEYEIGDINQDQEINILDVVTLVNIILTEQLLSCDQINLSDVNNDEYINVLDIVLLVSIIIG